MLQDRLADKKNKDNITIYIKYFGDEKNNRRNFFYLSSSSMYEPIFSYSQKYSCIFRP